MLRRGRTADPSASLGMTKGTLLALGGGLFWVRAEQQVPPLRFAQVGMTKGGVGEQQVPPLRFAPNDGSVVGGVGTVRTWLRSIGLYLLQG